MDSIILAEGGDANPSLTLFTAIISHDNDSFSNTDQMKFKNHPQSFKSPIEPDKKLNSGWPLIPLQYAKVKHKH